jgi:UDP-N-acetylmuramate-alanine ligase
MHTPDYLETLIEKASQKAGNDSKLAAMLHTKRQTVSHWKNGHKPCPVADQVLMAQIAGLDPQAWSARALIAQHEGTKKGDALILALGKAALATGAALSSFGASAHQISLDSVIYLIRCIKKPTYWPAMQRQL